MTSVRVPGFLPSTRGLHFPNAFPHVPNFRIDLPGGHSIPVGDAANGLCGGMAYTVRDMFEAGAVPPAVTTAPGRGPLFEYIAERLLESFDLPLGPATYMKLMHPRLPDGDVAILHGRAWRMIQVEWPAIRGDLDRGRLSPLGLVKAKSRDPKDLGKNHQVLAWGYDLEGTRLTLRLYDPNYPDDDHVTMALDLAHPRRATPVTCSHGGTVWCFFRTDYRFKDPWPVLAALAR